MNLDLKTVTGKYGVISLLLCDWRHAPLTREYEIRAERQGLHEKDQSGILVLPQIWIWQLLFFKSK